MRHKWIKKDKATSVCERCGLERFQEFAYGLHFTIFTINGKQYNTLNGDKMPVCLNNQKVKP
jgi:hypothetical protein